MSDPFIAVKSCKYIARGRRQRTLLWVLGADVSPNNRTKKFLKKQQLRDWLRVVSTSQGVYEIRFFNNSPNEDAEDEDE